jgi:hypothetical protein
LPGTGKTTALKNEILWARTGPRAVFVIDIHGTAQDILRCIPASEAGKVIHVCPYDPEFVVGINPLSRYEWTSDEDIRVTDCLVTMMARCYPNSWGDVIHDAFLFSTQAVLEATRDEHEQATIPDVLRFMMSAGYRQRILARVSNPLVLSMCDGDFLKWDSDSVRSSVRKLARTLSSSSLMACLSQKEGLDLRQALDDGLMVLFDFDQSHLGITQAELLAGLVLAQMEVIAKTRETKRRDHVDLLICDEFQAYANKALAEIISQCRKKDVGIVLAHQSAKAQLSSELQDAVRLASSHWYGRLALADAKAVVDEIGWRKLTFMEKVEYRWDHKKTAPKWIETLDARDLFELPNYVMVQRNLIDGKLETAKMQRLQPPPPANTDPTPIIEASRIKWGKPREQVLLSIQRQLFGGGL